LYRSQGVCDPAAADACPELQVIVTGSSSFELSNTITEPRTGR
jgi:hypothetical protein